MIFFLEGVCPICKQKGSKIDRDVLLYHVLDISEVKDKNYHICKNADCEIVYFGPTHSFTCRDLNKEVGFKNSSSQNALLCYCFNHKKRDIDKNTISKIEKNMKEVGCKCEIRNPLGGCCMSGIRKYIKK